MQIFFLRDRKKQSSSKGYLKISLLFEKWSSKLFTMLSISFVSASVKTHVRNRVQAFASALGKLCRDERTFLLHFEQAHFHTGFSWTCYICREAKAVFELRDPIPGPGPKQRLRACFILEEACRIPGSFQLVTFISCFYFQECYGKGCYGDSMTH